MLETQMIHQEAVQYRRFENYLIQHCLSWHSFAASLEIDISFGDLMLVTELSKTAAWSSAVYSNSSTELSLSFSGGAPFSTTGIGASHSLDKIGPIERRRSQQRAAESSPLLKDHSVFVKAYRLGTRQTYYYALVSLFMKARGKNRLGNRNDNEGAIETTLEPALPLPASQNSLHLPGYPEVVAMRPYEPVSHPPFETLTVLTCSVRILIPELLCLPL